MKKIVIIIVAAIITIITPIMAKADDLESIEVKRPECVELNEYMEQDLQNFIWWLASNRYPTDINTRKQYYASLIGLAEGESEFNINAVHKNNNGTVDRGLYQINSSNIKTFKKKGIITGADDLFNPYLCSICADYYWYNNCWIYGKYSETSYGYYLYGKKHKNNKSTARVWNMQQHWYKTIFKE